MKHEKIEVDSYVDGWVCVCGNCVGGSGFYPIDETVHVVASTEEAWKTNNYVCLDCGRVIDGNRFNVVRRIEPDTIVMEN